MAYEFCMVLSRCMIYSAVAAACNVFVCVPCCLVMTSSYD